MPFDMEEQRREFHENFDRDMRKLYRSAIINSALLGYGAQGCLLFFNFTLLAQPNPLTFWIVPISMIFNIYVMSRGWKQVNRWKAKLRAL